MVVAYTKMFFHSIEKEVRPRVVTSYYSSSSTTTTLGAGQCITYKIADVFRQFYSIATTPLLVDADVEVLELDSFSEDDE